jgi:hypothetical protein
MVWISVRMERLRLRQDAAFVALVNKADLTVRSFDFNGASDQ